MEEKKTVASQPQEKKVECEKCHQKVTLENAQKTKSGGYICLECAKKRKRIIYGAISAVVLCLIAGTVWFFVPSSDKAVTAEGFGGVSNVNDSVNVKVDAANAAFDIATATIASEGTAAQAPVSNIADFNRIFNENVDKAKSNSNNVLDVPTVSIMFGFQSAEINAEGSSMIKEVANVYAKTSKKNKIVVDGYACNIGDKLPNDYISQLRAEAVKTALVGAGVSEENIVINWYGKSKNSEFNLSRNADYRRVLVSFK